MKSESKPPILLASFLAVILIVGIIKAPAIIRAVTSEASLKKENEIFQFHVCYRAIDKHTNKEIPSEIRLSVNAPSNHSITDTCVKGESTMRFKVYAQVFEEKTGKLLTSETHWIEGHTVQTYDIIIESTNQSG